MRTVRRSALRILLLLALSEYPLSRSLMSAFDPKQTFAFPLGKLANRQVFWRLTLNGEIRGNVNLETFGGRYQ
jgi:hypothetical protein